MPYNNRLSLVDWLWIRVDYSITAQQQKEIPFIYYLIGCEQMDTRATQPTAGTSTFKLLSAVVS
jgi:hypothetical protein